VLSDLVANLPKLKHLDLSGSTLDQIGVPVEQVIRSIESEPATSRPIIEIVIGGK